MPSPQSDDKTSLRKRLFSGSSKKAAKVCKQDPDLLPVIDVTHGPENSGSTSTTLTGDPSTAETPVPHDREQASLNAKIKRKSFYQRRGGVASDGALSSNSATLFGRSRSRRKARNQSFISRFVHRVVPCVSPEPDTVTTPPTTASQLTKEKPRPSSETGGEKQPATATQQQQQQQQPSLSLVVPPPINVTAPPSPAESEVIVPPPPSAHTLPDDETDGLTSGAVQPPGSTGGEHHLVRTATRESSSQESDGTGFTDEEAELLDEQAEEERLIRNGGSGIPIGPDGLPKPLLPPIAPEHVGRKCLVLDLDETLVHSSFKAIPHPDFIVPVEIEYHWHHFHVLKRPGVDNFLKRMGELYEIVVFTASLSKYADPVLDKLDIHQVVTHRLFRESCFNHKGNYVKDLSQLGRPINDTIILDNSPASYIFNPTNAVPVSSWFNDPHDAELTDLIPFLADLTQVPDIRGILDPVR